MPDYDVIEGVKHFGYGNSRDGQPLIAKKSWMVSIIDYYRAYSCSKSAEYRFKVSENNGS